MESTNGGPEAGARPGTPAAGGRSWYWDALNALVLLLMLLFILRHPLRIDCDCATLLDAARMMVAGKLPYVDFVELNPPLILYLNALPVGLARALGASLPPVFLLLAWGVAALSSLALRSLLVRSLPEGDRAEAGFLALIPSACSLYILLSVTDFGQREQLFALVYLPCLVVRWVRWEGGKVHLSVAVITGLAAGIAACIKPYFVLIALAPELYWVLSRRRLRPLVQPETLLFVGVGLAYAAHFLLLPRAMREGWFGRWLPLIVTRYAAYNCSLKSALTGNGLPLFVVLGLLPFVVNAVRRSPSWTLARPLGAMTLAAAVAYVLQRKGFFYHSMPVLYGAAMVLGLLALRRKPAVLWAGEPGDGAFRLRVPRKVVGGLVLVLAGGPCLFLGWRLVRQGAAPPEPTPLSQVIQEHSRAGDAVLFLSTDPFPAYPTLLQMDRRPASRYYASLFPVALLYYGVKKEGEESFPYRVGHQAPPEEARVLRELAEDIATRKPALIFIDDSGHSQGCPVGFNILEYLAEVGFIEGAMQGYRPLTAVRTPPYRFTVYAPAPLGEATRLPLPLGEATRLPLPLGEGWGEGDFPQHQDKAPSP